MLGTIKLPRNLNQLNKGLLPKSNYELPVVEKQPVTERSNDPTEDQQAVPVLQPTEIKKSEAQKIEENKAMVRQIRATRYREYSARNMKPRPNLAAVEDSIDKPNIPKGQRFERQTGASMMESPSKNLPITKEPSRIQSANKNGRPLPPPTHPRTNRHRPSKPPLAVDSSQLEPRVLEPAQQQRISLDRYNSQDRSKPVMNDLNPVDFARN